MNEVKYMVVLLKGMVTPSGIVFRGAITHKDLVPPDTEVLGAGFCTISDITSTTSKMLPAVASIKCFGRASSMDIESRGEADADILSMTLTGTHSRFEY